MYVIVNARFLWVRYQNVSDSEWHSCCFFVNTFGITALLNTQIVTTPEDALIDKVR